MTDDHAEQPHPLIVSHWPDSLRREGCVKVFYDHLVNFVCGMLPGGVSLRDCPTRGCASGLHRSHLTSWKHEAIASHQKRLPARTRAAIMDMTPKKEADVVEGRQFLLTDIRLYRLIEADLEHICPFTEKATLKSSILEYVLKGSAMQTIAALVKMCVRLCSMFHR